MNHKYIIGIDPSGAFNEGKGTTGLAVLDVNTNKLAYVGYIAAVHFPSLEAYFDAHVDWLTRCTERYGKDIIVSIEDYILYADHAVAHTNTHLETSQLLGLIKWWCYKNNVQYTIRPAAAVKTRFTNAILAREGYIFEENGRLYARTRVSNNLSNHELDAIRHAAYCYKFELRHMNSGAVQTIQHSVEEAPIRRRPKRDYVRYLKTFANSTLHSLQVPFDEYFNDVSTMVRTLNTHIMEEHLKIDCIEHNKRIYLLKQ